MTVNHSCIHNESIPSGEFAVDRKVSRQVSAILGTCVSVILIDKKAGVSGLYHAILPEPPLSSIPADEQKAYASLGMPLFLRAMIEKGASVENIEAVIAGGALLSSLAKNDPLLDIGGRTVDIIKQHLSSEGIIVSNAETGGYFGYQVCLNMETFETKIEPYARISSSKSDSKETVTVDKLLRALEAIQPIPQVTLKVMNMLSDDDYSVRAVSILVNTDQVLTARVLRICNSALYSPKREISTIDHAFTYIGEKRFLQILLAMSIEPYFSSHPTDGYSLRKGGMYHHSLYVARISELLAMYLDYPDTAIAYTAGLLHDIGKVILDQFVSKMYNRFMRKVMLQNMAAIDVESEWFGMNHQEIGLLLAKSWQLPDVFRGPIGYHHNPEKMKSTSSLTHIVHLSDLIVTKFKAGLEIERISTNRLGSYFKSLSMSHEDVDSFIRSIHWRKLDQEILMQM